MRVGGHSCRHSGQEGNFVVTKRVINFEDRHTGCFFCLHYFNEDQFREIRISLHFAFLFWQKMNESFYSNRRQLIAQIL